jgi:hypothetical protein
VNHIAGSPSNRNNNPSCMPKSWPIALQKSSRPARLSRGNVRIRTTLEASGRSSKAFGLFLRDALHLLGFYSAETQVASL